MYLSHDNDLHDLSNGRGRPTVVQERAYFMAKSYWQEKEREEAEQPSGSPTTHATRSTLDSASWSRDE